ncbi:dihydrodipicolinate synthase family protein [Sphingobium aromaticiconvertens]|uniref:dihydrodipicolinate synthase family protein n=1 Tax=Sphingobium aromaticiconvertens TaxID=365341 RepID=UPI003016B35F
MIGAPPLRGVFSAAFTAFGPDGSVDLRRTAAHARGLIAAGCDGIASLGTTGEANGLSLAERKAVLEAVIAGGVDPVRIIPGTGLCSWPETVELTCHARACGVERVLLLPPFYYPTPSEAGLIDHFCRVIDGCADPGLRVLLYHIPQNSDVPITHGLLSALMDRYPGTIVGIKDSGGDINHMLGLLRAFPELAVFAGADHLTGPLLRIGGAGCITATSNLIAPLLADLYRRITGGEKGGATSRVEASRVEDRIGAARALFQQWPQIPALKAAHALRTGEPEWALVRAPMQMLTLGQQAEMAQAMQAAGLIAADEKKKDWAI